MTSEIKKEETKEEIIAIRKSAGEGDGENVFGTGLSHYILMDRKDEE